MKKETLKVELPLHKDKRSRNASLLTFDIPNLIEKMKHEHAWAKGELNAMILLKRPDKQIVLAALHEGTEINSFQSSDYLSDNRGKIKFSYPKKICKP